MYPINKPTFPDFFRNPMFLAAVAIIVALLFLCPPLIYLQRNGTTLSSWQLGTLILLPLVTLAILGYWGGTMLQQRLEKQQAAVLDSAFLQFGMSGQPFLMPGSRRFRGLWHGRDIDILFQPAQLFEWHLSTKLSIYWKVSNQQMAELSTVLLDPILFDGKRLYAYGTQLVRLANQPAIIPLLQRLLLTDGPFQTRSLELRDGRLIYRQSAYNTISEFRPTAAAIDQLMTDLIALLNQVESKTK